VRFVYLTLLALAAAWPAVAGPEVIWEELPERPERHAPAPIERQAPARPMPPPAERLPGPLTREQQRLFDGLRSDGIALYHQGRYSEAADRFRAALRLKPEDAVTQRWLRATENHRR
jgi:tetratricopeptide (TPR) repeat protein